MTVEARPAASLLPLRDTPGGVAVLMARRAPEMRFMGGAWVFPGGAVDEQDGPPGSDLAHRACAAREAAEEVGVTITDLDALVPFARWITPVEIPLRFDTRFYVVAAPAGEGRPDGTEIVEIEWITATTAIARAEAGTADIHFPTLKQLERLAEFADVESVLAAAREAEVEPILPRLDGLDTDSPRILLPGEPGY